MPKWVGPFWFDIVFGLTDLSDFVNTGHPILTIALTLILVNMNHALLTRDDPVMKLAKMGWRILVCCSN